MYLLHTLIDTVHIYFTCMYSICIYVHMCVCMRVCIKIMFYFLFFDVKLHA